MNTGVIEQESRTSAFGASLGSVDSTSGTSSSVAVASSTGDQHDYTITARVRLSLLTFSFLALARCFFLSCHFPLQFLSFV